MTPEPSVETVPKEVENALRDAIAEFGVLVPVCVDQNNHPIEGRHRARIADELGISYPVWTSFCADESERLQIRDSLNTDRGFLTTAQRRALIAYLRGRDHSYRSIARALRIGKATIAKDLRLSQERGPFSIPSSAESVSGGTALSTPPRPQQSARFVSMLAELTATCSTLSDLYDLSAVVTPDEARQWQPSVARALSGLRALQTRMKEYVQR